MRMIAAERRAAFALAGIYGLRMMGLFLVMPVLAIAARDFPGATPLLVGVAVGAYGLTQAVFQIPFGIVSDYFGRKRVIAAGLLLFGAGSALAAVADSIGLLILGRALQGAGAVSAALMALGADLTRDAVRTRVMAIIGISIGLSFSAALVLGPVFSAWFGVADLFWVSTGFALAAIALLFLAVPNPRIQRVHRDARPASSQLRGVLANRELLRLDGGIFVLHLVMTGTFVGAPMALADAGLASSAHWQVYLPVFGGSLAIMGPLVVLAERRDRTRPVFLVSLALIALAHAGLGMFGDGVIGIGLALLLFFAGFNVLESILPALVSRCAPVAQKGTAMGVYSTSQFLGAFVGGAGSGALEGIGGPPLIFGVLAVVAAAWLFVARSMRIPDHVDSRIVPLDAGTTGNPDQIARQLSGIAGVQEAVVVAEEGVAYLKVDRDAFSPEALRKAGFDA